MTDPQHLSIDKQEAKESRAWDDYLAELDWDRFANHYAADDPEAPWNQTENES